MRGIINIKAPSLVVLMHVLLFISSASIAFGTFTNTLFGWHPFTMSLGYLFFMAEGLLSAVAFRHVDAGAERVRGIDAHMAMQLRAVVLICIGAGTIIYNKVVHNKHHFQSLHAKAGLLTLVLTVAAPLTGAFSFRKLGLIHRFPERLHPRLKAMHRSLGAITWFMAVVTVQLALPHKAVYRPYITQAWQAAVAGIAVFMLVLLLRERPKPISSTVLKGV